MNIRDGLSDPDEQHSQSGIGVLERPETRRQEPGASRITGQPVVALCGKVWVPTREVSNHPICPRCVEIKKEMDSNGGADWPFRNPGDSR